jgi:predicted metal-dependent peptidase
MQNNTLDISEEKEIQNINEKVDDSKKAKILELYENDLCFLTVHYPWVSSLFLRLTVNVSALPAMAGVNPRLLCLNGKSQKGCPSYDELERFERYTLLIHEALHLMYSHFDFPTERYPNKMLANVCMDLIINRAIEDWKSPFFNGALVRKYPGVFDNASKTGFDLGPYKFEIPDYLKLDWFELYDWLQKNNPDFCDYVKQNYPADVDVDTITREEIESFNEVVIKVIVTFKECLGEAFKRTVDELTAPKVDWRRKLKLALTDSLNKSSFSFVGNSRKNHLGFLPRLIPEKQSKKIYLAIDTSGSMGVQELTDAVSQFYYLQKQFNCEVKVIVCDCEIHDVFDFDAKDINKWLSLPLRGNGGTDFRPVFSYLDNLKTLKKSDCLVFFTDTMGAFPDAPPLYKTIFLSNYSHASVPFGELILIQ